MLNVRQNINFSRLTRILYYWEFTLKVRIKCDYILGINRALFLLRNIVGLLSSSDRYSSFICSMYE